MRIEILGSGGAIIVPRPMCNCTVCVEARDKNSIPYVRYGPSVFIHDINLLIDTPEEISVQLNRSRIKQINAALFSHWHPDHTAGIRVFEANMDPERLWQYPTGVRTTSVYLPEVVARSFGQWHALEEKLNYLQRLRTVATTVVSTGKRFKIGPVTVTPFQVAEDYVCGFLFEDGKHRLMVCMDELFGWSPPEWLGTLDLAIMPGGLFEFNPLTGARAIPAEHPILQHEATFAQTLDMVRKLDAKRVVFIHLNEIDRLTPEQYSEVAHSLNEDQSAGLPHIEFAYDTMIIDLGE